MTRIVRQRSLIIMLICTVWLASLPALTPLSAAAVAPGGAGGDEFDFLRERWLRVLTGGEGLPKDDPDLAARQAAEDDRVKNGTAGVWDLLQTGASRDACGCLWTDLADSDKSGRLVVAYERLRLMALAYRTEGSRFYGSEELKQTVAEALDWMYENWYNERTVRYDNWYHWEMSGPQHLMDTVILLYDELPAERIAAYMKAVAAFSPDPNLTNGSPATGANRVEKAWVFMLRAIIVKNGSELALGRDALSDRTGTPTSNNGLYSVFAYTKMPETDGMHTDGSFLQHGPHPYIGNYGTTFFQLVANAMYLLSGSSWDIRDPEAVHLYRWIYDSFAPTLYKGGQMDMFRGRLISNPSVQSHVAGHRVIQAVLLTAEFAPEQDAEAFRRLAKAWLQDDTYRPFSRNAPAFYALLAKRLLADQTIVPRRDDTVNKLYTQSDRFVHRRPSFAVGLAMSSSRVYRYESINGNNLQGWRTGDGVTYLYNGDLAQYDEDYWATVDKYRLPGITADARKLNPAAGQSTKTPHNWVGGVSDGEFGMAGMQVTPYGTTLTAKKSWFFGDDEFIALGAGITSSSAERAETIVDARKLSNPSRQPLTVQGAQQPTEPAAGERSLLGTGWAHLSGEETNADIGYYFPEPVELGTLREERTATWGDSQTGAATEPITRAYQTLALNHGVKPAGATYLYAVLPGKTAAGTEQYAMNPDFTVLANTPEVQAVQERKLQRIGANFWNDREATVEADGQPWLTSRSQASVLTFMNNNGVDIYAADPTQRRTTPLELELHRPALGIAALDPGVTVTQLQPTVRLSIDVNGAKGASKHIRLLFTGGDDSKPPEQPQGLLAMAASRSEIRLQWEHAVDDQGVAGYEVFRGGVHVATVHSPGWTDSRLAADTAYTYTVRAIDTAGRRSSFSEPATARTLQTSFYLIRDSFDGALPGQPPAGYELDTAGGSVTTEEVQGRGSAVRLEDNRTDKAVVLSKSLGVQSRPIYIGFDLMLPTRSDYHSWILKGDGGANAVTLATAGGQLVYKNSAGGDVALMPYEANRWYAIAMLADPVTDRLSVYVDGVLRASGVPFRTNVTTLTQWTAATGVAGTGAHYVDEVTAYAWAPFIEDAFDAESERAAPAGYKLKGGDWLQVRKVPGHDGLAAWADAEGAEERVTAVKSFPPQRHMVGLQAELYLTEKSEGAAWGLIGASEQEAVTLSVYGGRFQVHGGAEHPVDAGPIRGNGWQTIRLLADIQRQSYDLFVNGALRAENIPFVNSADVLEGVRFTAGGKEGGTYGLDEVKVYPLVYLIDDRYDELPASAAPPAYTLDLGGNTIRVEDTDGGQRRSLKFTDTTNKAAVATKTFATRTDPVVTEFEIMLPSQVAYHSWNVKDEAGTNAVTVMTSVLNGRHVLIYKNAEGGDTFLADYEVGRWHRLKLIADPQRGRFTAYVDGEPKAVDVPFRYPASTVGRFAASTATGGSGVFYMDNLRAYPLGERESELPLVELLGEPLIDMSLEDSYAEPGYRATSVYYGDVTDRVQVTGKVDAGREGGYELQYTASDPSGRTGPPSFRFVQVRQRMGIAEATASSSFVNNDGILEIKARVWHKEGAKLIVRAAVGGVEKSVVLDPPPTSPAGEAVILRWAGTELPEGRWTAEVTASTEDEKVVTASLSEAIIVDRTAPSVALTMTLPDGSRYEPGEVSLSSVTVTADAYDAHSGIGEIQYRLNEADWFVYELPVLIEESGRHRLEWQAVDRAGNRSMPVVADVYISRQEPVIVLLGDNPLTVPWQGVYEEPGYRASSLYYGDLTSQVTVTGDVYTNRPGVYRLLYAVTDPGGTPSAVKERLVIVKKSDYEEPDESHEPEETGNSNQGGSGSQHPSTGMPDVPAADAPVLRVHGRSEPFQDMRLVGGELVAAIPASGGGYELELPEAVIRSWAKQADTVRLETTWSSILLPAAGLLRLLGHENGKLLLQVEQSEMRNELLAQLPGEAIGKPLAVKLSWVPERGPARELSGPGFLDLITMSLRQPSLTDAAIAGRSVGVVRFDPATGDIRPVPANLRLRVGGEAEMLFRSNSGGIYVAATSSGAKEWRDLAGHWAEKTVLDLGGQLLLQGTKADAFEPERPVNRAEFAAMLVRGLGLLETGGKNEALWPDVSPTSWYAHAAAAAAEHRLIEGYPDGTFRPDGEVTRQEAAVMLERAMRSLMRLHEEANGESNKLGEDTAASKYFGDAEEIAEFAREAVARLAEAGWLQGDESNRFNPADALSRAEAATLLKRLILASFP